MDLTLTKIKNAVEDMKFKYPDYPIYITVTKDFNEKLINYLNSCGENKENQLEFQLYSLHGCKYKVSPFLDNGVERMVGLFDYAQILGMWNTTNDNQYRISHLLDYIIL